LAHLTKPIVAFVLVAALRSLIVKCEERTWSLSAFSWGGGLMAATVVLAGNADSRTPAFASMDDNFKLDPNSARLLNDRSSVWLSSRGANVR
jgi:hypothetical protein